MLVVPYYISVLKGLYMNSTHQEVVFFVLLFVYKVLILYLLLPPRFVNLY